MRSFKVITAIIFIALTTVTLNPRHSLANNVRLDDGISLAAVANRYRLDASQSKFIAHALAGGLLWFKGHNHLVAVREFTREAELTPNSIILASLVITAKTASMVETSSVFTQAQKQIINKEAQSSMRSRSPSN